ncbi:protein-tyrosine phosphatase-like protein [Protomyces lactucae-debilis]|uniref:Protein-tyrosine phosphatase-like protein n=1 Tax=Protomyces lactucae-debilis TaxID=2754530 RepID=A0A1Y2F2K3_PROLT|nr:protein-tyrosine phosphatase-like protein [Protomyces lactucae-debilis]ORY77714.1 protein-tyrosine phosphatase-like protein [Protomyces lactucae-debilis]
MSLSQVFQKLEAAQAQRLEVAAGHTSTFSYRDAQTRLARHKNRYSDIVPFDRNRIKLRDAPSEQHAADDYINASLIECTSKRRYIACQGPLDHTAADFWQMVWQDSSLIVMLCDVMENGRPKCARYWPDVLDQVATFESTRDKPRRSFTVKCLGTHYDAPADTQVTRLRLSHNGLQKSKNVTHLRFCSWPDYGVADIEKLKALVKVVEVHRLEQVGKELPIVHCSAGCGRTGTFIAMSILQLDAPETPVSELVDMLRRQRISMVQSYSQFELLHQYQALCKAHR